MMKLIAIITVLMLTGCIKAIKSTANQPYFKVGDCIALTSNIEELAEHRDAWENRKLPWVDKIIELGEDSFRTNTYWAEGMVIASSIKYKNQVVYSLIDCSDPLIGNK